MSLASPPASPTRGRPSEADMLRPIAFVASLSLGLLVLPVQAQQQIGANGVPATSCLYADRAFSPGAYLCVAKSLAIACADGRWSPQRAQPCEHELDPFKPPVR